MWLLHDDDDDARQSDSVTFLDWLTVFGAACWPVCFWWMYRISKNQTAMLEDLRRQAKKVHEVSREEHELTKELHPKLDQRASSFANPACPLMSDPRRTDWSLR